MTMLTRILLLALTVASCSSVGPAPVLDGRQFLSTSIVDGGVQRPLVAGTRVRIQFAQGRMSISAGCNIMGGEYRIDAGRLVTDGLAMTEMGCDQARHAQDDWLSEFIGSGPTLRVNGDDLILERDGVVLTALDQRGQ